MKHGVFIDNVINFFGDWIAQKKSKYTQSQLNFQKEQFIKWVTEAYTEDELDYLWEKVKINCEYRPSPRVLNEMIPGRVVVKKHISGYMPSVFGLEDEYTTETGRFMGSKLKDFMKPGKIDSMGSLHVMTEDEQQQHIVRTVMFWDGLIKAIGKIPDKIKEQAFYPERCKECGKRIGQEREKSEAYCRACGSNILNPLNVMRDIGTGQIGQMLAESMAKKSGVKHTAPESLEL